jgi:protein-S-isoprenylcysteine O-methyltransferase Ste14
VLHPALRFFQLRCLFKKTFMNQEIGNFLFRYRNALGPLLFLSALVMGQPSYPFGRSDWNGIFDLAGVLCALLGQALRIITIGYEYIERGGKNRQVYASRLVQGGVFGHCRNPLYVGNILMAFGFSLIVHSYAFYIVVVPMILFTYSCIVTAEESFLRTKFGNEYDCYCQRVNRWWLSWKGWRSSIEDMQFNWRRVLVKEYNTLFILIFSLVAVKLWSEYRIVGKDALPPMEVLMEGLLAWLVLYILVRSLKKGGFVRA